MYWCKGDPNSVADALAEYQLWRRGQGKYGENEVTAEYVHVPCPFDPKELGEIEDAAIAFLRGIKKGGVQ